MLKGLFAASVPGAIDARNNSDIDRFILSYVVFALSMELPVKIELRSYAEYWCGGWMMMKRVHSAAGLVAS